MDYIAGVSGLTLNQVSPGGTSNAATMVFGAYDANDGSGAYAYFPGSTATNSVAGDLWLNNNSGSTTSLPIGSYSYFVLLHEIGHAIGLAHPGDYNAAPGVSITYANDAQFIEDSHQYTVMSYFDESYTTTSVGGYPDTLLLFDLLAIHQQYGADLTFHAGNTIYGFNATVGGAYDFTTNANPLLSIWDGSGTDTIDLSGYSMAQTLNLTAGTFSSVGGFSDNLSIAIGAVIENAVGGSAGDAITGNAIGNTMSGGNGNDTLMGGAGNDVLFGDEQNDLLLGEAGDDSLDGGLNDDLMYGGDGADWLQGNSGADVIYGGIGNDEIRGGRDNDRLFGENGNDTMYGAKGDDSLDGGLDDDLMYGGDGADWLQGNSGADVIYGGDGNDTLRGGQDNDEIHGGNNDDWIKGALGNDTLSGGAGADTFVFTPDFGTDIVLDYELGIDHLSLDDALWGGANLTAAQVISTYARIDGNNNVVLDFGLNEVTLLGVTSTAGLDQDLLIV